MTDDVNPSLPPPPNLPPPPPGPGLPQWAPAPVGPPRLKALRGLTMAVLVLLTMTAVVNVASTPTDLAYLDSLERVHDGDFGYDLVDDIQTQEDTRGALAGLSLGALVITGVVWIVWQQRARANAKALGGGGQRHSEPLAALSWIIPIGNLWLPKQVTDDLWRASDPEAPPVMNVNGRPVAGLLSAWWALWILGAVIGRVLFSQDEPETVEDIPGLMTTVRFEIASSFLLLGCAILGGIVVKRITDRLAQRATNAGTHLP